MLKKLLILIGLFVLSVGSINATSYHYPCHLKIGKTYGLGDGSSNAIEYQNLVEAEKNGDFNYWRGLFATDWDTLCVELQKAGIATHYGHQAINIIEGYDLTPTVKCHIADFPVKIGPFYDPDYYDVIFE